MKRVVKTLTIKLLLYELAHKSILTSIDTFYGYIYYVCYMKHYEASLIRLNDQKRFLIFD